MTDRGELTAKMGKWLMKELKPRGYDVLYDHGSSKEGSGKIVSWFGEALDRGARLSELDIAIVEQSSDKAVALIEIEESNDRPKTLLGNIFGFLMGEQVTFGKSPKKRKKLLIGPWTTLLVLGKSEDPNPKHIGYIHDNVEKVRSTLPTANSKIGKVEIKPFTDEKKLAKLLQDLASSI